MMILPKENFDFLLTELGQTKLVAVTKHRDIAAIEKLIAYGQRHFGENRVEELLEKANYFESSSPDLSENLKWHFIGNLQRNKVKKLLQIPNLYAIHSIDRLKLLNEVLKHDEKLKQKIFLFMQVNASQEDEKSGVNSEEELLEIFATFFSSKCKNFEIKGLMGMAGIRGGERIDLAKQAFQRVQEYSQKIKAYYPSVRELELSIGMSGDFRIALTYGSNWVRIGSMLFEKT